MPATTARWAAVRLPDGEWGQLKVVPSDGFRPWNPSNGLLLITAYVSHRLIMRTRWCLQRHRRWEVRVYRFPDPAAPRPVRWEQQSRPLLRSIQSSKAEALTEAKRVVDDLRSGKRLW